MNKAKILKLTFLFIVMTALLAGAGYYRYVYNKPYNLLANPYDDIRAALPKVNKERPLLIILGANWCPECRHLASELSQPPLKDVINSSFELVKIDVNGWDRNMDIVKALGNPIKGGIPTILLLDNHKQILLTRTGTQFANDLLSSGTYLNYFTSLSEHYKNRDDTTNRNDILKLDI